MVFQNNKWQQIVMQMITASSGLASPKTNRFAIKFAAMTKMLSSEPPQSRAEQSRKPNQNNSNQTKSDQKIIIESKYYIIFELNDG